MIRKKAITIWAYQPANHQSRSSVTQYYLCLKKEAASTVILNTQRVFTRGVTLATTDSREVEERFRKISTILFSQVGQLKSFTHQNPATCRDSGCGQEVLKLGMYVHGLTSFIGPLVFFLHPGKFPFWRQMIHSVRKIFLAPKLTISLQSRNRRNAICLVFRCRSHTN